MRHRMDMPPAHRRYAMNHDTLCDPVPGAEVDGFNFFRDQNGSVSARCCWCFDRI